MINLKQTLPSAGLPAEDASNPSGRPGRRRSSHPPDGRRQQASPPAAHEWAMRARVLADAIEATLAIEAPPIKAIAAIERAYAGYYLDDISEADIAHVAHLCERAYDAIRKVRPAQVEAGLVNCARVLRLGLPQQLADTVTEEYLIRVVRELRTEPNRSRGVTEATMRVLGWQDKFRDRAELVVLMALREFSRPASEYEPGGR